MQTYSLFETVLLIVNNKGFVNNVKLNLNWNKDFSSLLTKIKYSSFPVSVVTIGSLGCDDSEIPTTKKVAHINSCSVELSQESG